MSNLPMKRGERMARWMIGRLAAAGVAVEPVKQSDGWALKFANAGAHSDEQRERAVEAVMFGIGYPRNFATMCLILQREAAQ